MLPRPAGIIIAGMRAPQLADVMPIRSGMECWHAMEFHLSHCYLKGSNITHPDTAHFPCDYAVYCGPSLVVTLVVFSLKINNRPHTHTEADSLTQMEGTW